MTSLVSAATLAAALLIHFPIGAARAQEAAQEPESATMPTAPASGPAVPPAGIANPQDHTFVHIAGVGGLAEVEIGRLAAEKAASGDVRAFADRMLKDHGPANDKLAQLAEEHGIDMPTELDDDHRAMRDHLETLSGATFDLTYMRGQVADHQKTVQLLEWEIISGQDRALKDFAAETLPTVLRHLEMARAIVTELALQAAR